MHVYDLQSYKAQSLPQKDLFYLKLKADPDRAKTLIQTRPHMLRHDVEILRNAGPNVARKERRRGFSNRSSSMMQPWQGDPVCFYVKAKALYLAFR